MQFAFWPSTEAEPYLDTVSIGVAGPGREMRCFVNVRLAFAVRNSALTEIIRSQFYGNAIAGHDSDKMLPHLASNMSYNSMAVFEFYTKLSPWEGLDDYTRQFDYFFTSSHKYNKG